MKKPFLILLFCLFTATCIAQLNREPISYRTGFFNNYWKNPDSALIFARKLAADTNYNTYLHQALHEDFMTSFSDTTREIYKNKAISNNVYNAAFDAEYDKVMAVCYKTLQLMATDKHIRLSDISTPMYTWATIQQKLHNQENVKGMVTSFIKDQLSKDNIYASMAGRYALLIYLAINTKPEYQNQANELLLTTINKLSTLQIENDILSLSSKVLAKRALLRFDYATANYYMANNLIKRGEIENAGAFFKTAAKFSPDLADLAETSLSEIDILGFGPMMFSHNQRDFYNTGYLNYLQKYNADKRETLDALAQMSLKNPSLYMARLKSYYAENFKGREDFKKYWESEINSNFEMVPATTIKVAGKLVYPLLDNADKWTLIDFWGTWCGPCREEHPDLQKFYLNAKNNFPGKINIVTIACRDTEKSVKDYMEQFKYSFPVALDVDNLSKTFNVLGYPTKILITPGGKYLQIPHAVDWVDFIKQYASL